MDPRAIEEPNLFAAALAHEVRNPLATINHILKANHATIEVHSEGRKGNAFHSILRRGSVDLLLIQFAGNGKEF
jgi:hypothetical protein